MDAPLKGRRHSTRRSRLDTCRCCTQSPPGGLRLCSRSPQPRPEPSGRRSPWEAESERPDRLRQTLEAPGYCPGHSRTSAGWRGSRQLYPGNLAGQRSAGLEVFLVGPRRDRPWLQRCDHSRLGRPPVPGSNTYVPGRRSFGLPSRVSATWPQSLVTCCRRRSTSSGPKRQGSRRAPNCHAVPGDVRKPVFQLCACATEGSTSSNASVTVGIMSFTYAIVATRTASWLPVSAAEIIALTSAIASGS